VARRRPPGRNPRYAGPAPTRQTRSAAVDAQAAQETGLRAEIAGHRQAALLWLGVSASSADLPSSAGSQKQQSGGELASGGATTRAQDATVQISTIRPRLSQYPCCRPQLFQCSTPPRLPCHAAKPPRRSQRAVAGCSRSRMTPGQSQARSSYVIGYRDKALAYPARVGAMAGTPSRIGRNGSGTIERIRLAAGGSEIRTLGPPGCDELASKRAPRTHRFPAEARTPSIGGANSANDLAYSGAACTAFGPIWQPQSPEIARDAGRRSRRGSRYDGSNRREAAAIFAARDDPTYPGPRVLHRPDPVSSGRCDRG